MRVVNRAQGGTGHGVAGARSGRRAIAEGTTPSPDADAGAGGTPRPPLVHHPWAASASFHETEKFKGGKAKRSARPGSDVYRW